jgi:hypothetical protein
MYGSSKILRSWTGRLRDTDMQILVSYIEFIRRERLSELVTQMRQTSSSLDTILTPGHQYDCNHHNHMKNKKLNKGTGRSGRQRDKHKFTGWHYSGGGGDDEPWNWEDGVIRGGMER